MPEATEHETLTIDNHEIRITHPEKPYFTREARLTKLDIVRYYLAVAPGALNGIRNRPIVLKRFVNGAEQPPFYQKRAPSDRPAWLPTVTLAFPSGRTAEEIVVDSTAGLAWIVNLGCIELHPHPVRDSDLDHPDELRIDLDPIPGVPWQNVLTVAQEVHAVLDSVNLRAWPKTSGSRGMHINVRIHPRWTFTEVRRAALALAREVERRIPTLASSKWWKEERHGVFLDYNQNAKDRTTASAYSVRPLPDARVSAPLHWHEVPTVNPADFTVASMPARFASIGDPHADMDAHPGGLELLLELAARDEASGLADAPWPPHFRKAEGEAPRVRPSKARSTSSARSHGPAHPSGTAGSVATPTRRTRMPLITIANSPSETEALAGLDRWKLRHPEAAQHLAIDDILNDRMRGSSYIWTRIRINLRHVPEDLRPPQQTPDPDEDPTRAWRTTSTKPKPTKKSAPTDTNANEKRTPKPRTKKTKSP